METIINLMKALENGNITQAINSRRTPDRQFSLPIEEA